MNTEKHDIVLTRLVQRKQRQGQVEAKATELATLAMTKSLTVQGWNIAFTGHDEQKLDVTEQADGAVWRYSMYLELSFAHNSNQPNSNMYLALVRTIGKVAGSAKIGGWKIDSVDDEEYEQLDDDDAPLAKDFVGYVSVELPADFDTHFGHLFGVEHQLGMLRSKLEASIADDWNRRYHTVLVGPPGCGKSDMAHTLKQMLGDDAVLEFDCTSLTAAGAIEILKDLPILPRILILEEAEKITSDQVSSFLLALMDQRGEIRKNTARQSIQRDTKLFCIATVNDYKQFKKLNRGALSSRFGKPVHFNRPTRMQMEMILEREIARVDGNLAWIKPTIDYVEKHNIQDTREIIDLCMCGREQWLEDGAEKGISKYEEMLDATSPGAEPDDDDYILTEENEAFADKLKKFLQDRD